MNVLWADPAQLSPARIVDSCNLQGVPLAYGGHIARRIAILRSERAEQLGMEKLRRIGVTPAPQSSHYNQFQQPFECPEQVHRARNRPNPTPRFEGCGYGVDAKVPAIGQSHGCDHSNAATAITAIVNSSRKVLFVFNSIVQLAAFASAVAISRSR